MGPMASSSLRYSLAILGAACLAIAAAAAPTATLAPATLKLDIKPDGEVLVDGVSHGKTPPLTSIQIPAGRHKIEIRHARASPIVLQVDAGAGEELSIRHSFTPPPTLEQQKSVWRKFLDQFK